MKALILAIVFFCNFAAIGQDLPSREIISPSNFLTYLKGDNNIKGSTFLYDDWSSKIIVFGTDNSIYRYSNANYNLKERKFFVKLKNDSIYEINIKSLKYVVLNNKKFEFLNDDYVERIAKGKINVFKKHELGIKEGMIDGTTKEKMTPDTYVVKSNFCVLQDGDLVPFKLKKKTVLSLLELSNKKEFTSEIKRRKLSFSNEEDLVKILEYYNAL